MIYVDWFLWMSGIVLWLLLVMVGSLHARWRWVDRHPMAPVAYRPRRGFGH